MDATALTILLMGLAMLAYAALDVRNRVQERRTENAAWDENDRRDWDGGIAELAAKIRAGRADA
jgi:hypothetical protein